MTTPRQTVTYRVKATLWALNGESRKSLADQRSACYIAGGSVMKGRMVLAVSVSLVLAGAFGLMADTYELSRQELASVSGGVVCGQECLYSHDLVCEPSTDENLGNCELGLFGGCSLSTANQYCGRTACSPGDAINDCFDTEDESECEHTMTVVCAGTWKSNVCATIYDSFLDAFFCGCKPNTEMDCEGDEPSC